MNNLVNWTVSLKKELKLLSKALKNLNNKKIVKNKKKFKISQLNKNT